MPADMEDAMNSQTATTVLRGRDDVARLWDSPGYRAEHIREAGATVAFKEAPGGRGTEIHVDLGPSRGGKLGGLVPILGRAGGLGKVKDDLRRFKQMAETGVIARSDAAPEGELAERKLKQRPAQPLQQSELQKAGVA
jgi:uncharacterized membrane protein